MLRSVPDIQSESPTMIVEIRKGTAATLTPWRLATGERCQPSSLCLSGFTFEPNFLHFALWIDQKGMARGHFASL